MSGELQGDDLEDLLRNEADHFRVEPSADLWAKIENRIKRKRTFTFFFWWGAAILFLAGSGSLYYMTRNNPHLFPFSSTGTVARLSHKSAGIPLYPSINFSSAKGVPGQHKYPGLPPTNDAHPAIQMMNHPMVKSSQLILRGSATSLPNHFKISQPGEVGKKRKGLIFAQSDEERGTVHLNFLTGSIAAINFPYLFTFRDSAQLSKSNAFATSLAGIAFFNQQDRLISKPIVSSGSPPSSLEKKHHQGILLELFLTPGVSYRSLFQQHDPSVYRNSPYLSLAALNLAGSASLQPGSLNQHPDFGFSAGANLNFSLWKKLHLITGLQLDKFGYIIKAVQINPVYIPSSANPYSGQVSNNFSTSPGGNSNLGVYSNYASGLSKVVTIHNQYLGMEIPLLLNVELPMKNGWKLNLTSGLGVNFLLYKRVHIISPTYQRYFSDNSLVKNRDLIYDFSSYLSLPISRKKGIDFQIGPDFQYLLFSTYSQNYMVEEHPFSFGLRMGISFRP